MLSLLCFCLGAGAINLSLVMPLNICRMLVMERLRGVPLTDLAAIQRVTDVDPESILVNALNTWFGSVLACETFHADMCVPSPTSSCALFFHDGIGFYEDTHDMNKAYRSAPKSDEAAWSSDAVFRRSAT